MQTRKENILASFRRQAPPLAMLLVASILHLGSLSRALFDDDSVVESRRLAMADDTELDSICSATRPDTTTTDGWCAAPPAEEPAALPFLLVYRDPFAPSTPAPWTDGVELGEIALAAAELPAVVQTGAPSESIGKLPFNPMAEPAFDRAKDPFVLVRDEAGNEIARGWLPAQRGDLVWQGPLPRTRTPFGPPILEEYLARLKSLRTDPHVVEFERKARGGETLARLLEDARLEPREIDMWVDSLQGAAAVERLTRGQRVSLLIDKRDRAPRQLSVDLDDKFMLVALQRGPTVVAERVPIPYMKRMRAVGGDIETSLHAAASADDVPKKTVAEMAEILGWEMDLSKLGRGASYRAVYEETVRLDTGNRSAGRILAVEITDGQRTHDAYYFAATGGEGGSYYTRDARPIDGKFLRYPVAYTRISSLFSDSRFHPIKNRHLPHYGVDFAAPIGTPVVAVADGTVSKAGWYGSNGRLVRIHHDGTYDSAYAHLARIEIGVTPGARIRQGEVIGYVGSSGLSTGPHLHFAMYRDGEYVDPLKVSPGYKPTLAGVSKTAFQLALGNVDDALDRAGLGRDAVVQVSMASPRYTRDLSR